MAAQPIIFFDDVCVLCNGLVRLVLRVDIHEIFLFASLGSGAAEQNLSRSQEVREGVDSFILLNDDKVYVRSRAVFEILQQLGWPWKLLLVFRLLPLRITDHLYDFVARNRYHWFGRYEACPVPTATMRKRMLS